MLNSSSKQFKIFADNVFALYGNVSLEGNLSDVEGELLKEFDIGNESLIGQSFLDSIIWQTDDSNVSDLRDAFNEAKENGISSKVSLKFRGNAKEFRRVQLKFVPSFDDEVNRIFFCVDDITDLHGQIKEYKDRFEYFLHAADVADVGLWLWNLGIDDIYTTPKCNKIFELSEDDKLTYEYFLTIIHPDDLEKVKAKVSESADDKTEFSIQYRVIYSDGNINWLWSHGKTIFNEELKAKMMIGSVRVINDSKAASAELERIYQLEKKAKFEAEKANKTKDFFLALVSHELRSPLNAILGWTNILLKKEVDKDTKTRALETIERSARTQSKLIEDLVDSARVTSGKLKLELRPLNLHEILLNVYNSHIPSMQDKNIKHKFNFESDRTEVIGDTMRLRQVFSNLIGNAIKFTPENCEISLSQTIKDENVIIEIKDTGQGIDKEDLPFIFNRFAQGDENYVKEKSGLGLGLSLARILVENHRGTINVQSEGLSTGSTFTVTLPVVSKNLEVFKQPDKATAGENENGIDRLKGKHILVVEDDEDSRNVLEIYLSQIGAIVQCAESVREAFKLLNKPESVLPDLIISDIGMPNEDGYSFIQKIRGSSEYKDIPAIALSAFTAEENKKKAFEAGFQTYHTKPFEPDQLSEEIVKLLTSD